MDFIFKLLFPFSSQQFYKFEFCKAHTDCGIKHESIIIGTSGSRARRGVGGSHPDAPP